MQTFLELRRTHDEALKTPSSWSIGPPPPIFRPKWGPSARKIFLRERAFPLSQGLDDHPPTPPPLTWRYGSTTDVCMGGLKIVNTLNMSGIFIVLWPMTAKIRTCESAIRPQTNYRCCLWFSMSKPDGLFPWNTCNRFPEIFVVFMVFWVSQ